MSACASRPLNRFSSSTRKPSDVESEPAAGECCLSRHQGSGIRWLAQRMMLIPPWIARLASYCRVARRKRVAESCLTSRSHPGIGARGSATRRPLALPPERSSCTLAVTTVRDGVQAAGRETSTYRHAHVVHGRNGDNASHLFDALGERRCCHPFAVVRRWAGGTASGGVSRECHQLRD
jgi:hypothetical protein